jgi:transglutaminase-like putative cysteine protease
MTGLTRLTIVGAIASGLAVLSLAPLTEEHSWVVPAALAIAIVAGVGIGLRRLRVPLLLVASAQLVALVLWLGVLVAADVAWFGVVPTTAWAKRMAIVFLDGFDAVMQYAAPVAVTRGILLFLVGGAGLVALLVDFFACGVRRVPLTGLALGAVYAVSASVAPGGLAWYWFVLPAAGFLAVLVAEGRTRVLRWGRSAGPSASHSGVPETDSLARNGRRVGVVAIAAAVAVPALLPGLTEGVFGRGGGSGEGGRTIHTDNPIVDLQGDLTQPENVPVLRYETDAQTPEYIRRVTLDVFTGEEWQTSDRSVPDSQRVSEGMPAPPGLDPPDAGIRREYVFDVGTNYESSWLPLPYPAQEIEIDGDWRYDRASLDVVSPERNAQDVDYRVVSLEIDIDPVDLIAAAAPAEEDFLPLRQLPDDLPAEVIDLAREVTANATSAFERAAVLQAFFRSEGGFDYDLETEPGNSSSALVNFLDNRRGYCEQFAASMAVMARVVGIPSRVAVGFTPGTRQDDGSWLVGIHDAHAWPELYFSGTGWVRFEPTPAARTGSVPTWTVPPALGEDGSSTETDVPAGQGNQAEGPIPGLEDPDLLAGDTSGTGVSPWIAALLAVAGGSLVLAMPTIIAQIRRAFRWRRAGGDRIREAEAAWSDLRDTSRDAGFDWDPAATPRQTGRTLAAEAKLDGDSNDLLGYVVTTTERARYSADPADTEGLRQDSAMLRRTILRSRSPLQRFGAVIWPAATRDAVVRSANRVADGLDWTDAAGARVRERTGRLLGRAR